ncbi:hypothetical protein [Burkholderia catarinensis]|uniref:hypothetical protein n=1 Tax=Burkholderia catarinensis TaxID=1108140 RepID=UPI003FD8E069
MRSLVASSLQCRYVRKRVGRLLRFVGRTPHEDFIRAVSVAFELTRERRRISRQRERFHRRTEARYLVLAEHRERATHAVNLGARSLQVGDYVDVEVAHESHDVPLAVEGRFDETEHGLAGERIDCRRLLLDAARVAPAARHVAADTRPASNGGASRTVSHRSRFSKFDISTIIE